MEPSPETELLCPWDSGPPGAGRGEGGSWQGEEGLGARHLAALQGSPGPGRGRWAQRPEGLIPWPQERAPGKSRGPPHHFTRLLVVNINNMISSPTSRLRGHQALREGGAGGGGGSADRISPVSPPGKGPHGLGTHFTDGETETSSEAGPCPWQPFLLKVPEPSAWPRPQPRPSQQAPGAGRVRDWGTDEP